MAARGGGGGAGRAEGAEPGRRGRPFPGRGRGGPRRPPLGAEGAAHTFAGQFLRLLLLPKGRLRWLGGWASWGSTFEGFF